MAEKVKVGFCLTGSFCTFKEVLLQMEFLQKFYEVYPIMSFNAGNTDTRFFKFKDLREEVTRITNKPIMDTLCMVEPLGPKKVLDILVVCPCTGNSLAKIANGISDTPAVLAVKSHLRNKRPVVIGISTNDGLAGSAKNIGMLLDKKNIFFVPFSQDDAVEKPTSLVANFKLLKETIDLALKNIQIQPLLY